MREGRKLCFWNDCWFRDESSCMDYLTLFYLVSFKEATVAEVWDPTSVERLEFFVFKTFQ